MPNILNEQSTATGDSTGETPAYSSWAEVGSATALDADVVVTNDYAADIWLQWATDTNNPDEPVDVFLVGQDNGSGHYRVVAENQEPAGTHVRVKVVAWDTHADCHANLTTH